jgi:hypothetical protein
MAFGFKGGKEQKAAEAESYAKGRFSAMIAENKPYAEITREYYSAVKNWMHVNKTADEMKKDDERIMRLIGEAKFAGPGAGEQETANLALWKELNSLWIERSIAALSPISRARASSETSAASNAADATIVFRQLLAMYVDAQPEFRPFGEIAGEEHYNYFADRIIERHDRDNYKGYDHGWWFVHNFLLELWRYNKRQEEEREDKGKGAQYTPPPPPPPTSELRGREKKREGDAPRTTPSETPRGEANRPETTPRQEDKEPETGVPPPQPPTPQPPVSSTKTEERVDMPSKLSGAPNGNSAGKKQVSISNTEQERRIIGNVFVRHCHRGAMLDRSEYYQNELRKQPGFATAEVRYIYRDANRGPRSLLFFEDAAKTKARVNYWRVIVNGASYLLPEPRTLTQFSDVNLDAFFPLGEITPSTIDHILPVYLKQGNAAGEWIAEVAAQTP